MWSKTWRSLSKYPFQRKNVSNERRRRVDLSPFFFLDIIPMPQTIDTMRCTNLLLTRSRRLVRNVCLIVCRCEHGLPISGLVSPDVWLAQLKPFGNRKLIIACRSSRLDTTFSARRTVNKCLAAAISTRFLVVVCGQVLWWTDIAKEIIKLVRRRTLYVSTKWKFKAYIGSIRSRRACSGWYYIDSKSVAFS